MESGYLSAGVRGIAAGYKSGRVSPVEVTKACLRQVLKYNPALGAICHLDEGAALKSARESEKRWRAGKPKGPLDGIPTTVKDWYDAEGWPTRYGSKTSAAHPQEKDSPPVAALRAAGAVLIGKTTLPEFGHKGVTDSPLCGVTRNPWDPSKTPGGSSGGAAVAAATGMAPLNLGSDAGGSVRIPASFTGVVGVKPSPGLIPVWPPSVFASLTSLGSLTRSVEDAALMLDAVMRPYARDWNALPVPRPELFAALKKPLGKLKIAYAPVINGVRAHKDARAVIDAKIKILSTLGEVEEIALDCPSMVDVFITHWMTIGASHVATLKAADRKKLDPHYLHWAKRGEKVHLYQYIEAEKARMHIGSYFKGILDEYDILVTPTTPMTAFATGIDMPKDEKGRQITDIWTPFTLPANLAKLPAVSLPLGLTAAGMPVGLQIMSGFLKDALAVRVAAKLEREIAFEGWLERSV